MLIYSHPWLAFAFIIDYWSATVFLPSVLLLVAVLALITRWWHRRDAAPAQEQAALHADFHVEPSQSASSTEDQVEIELPA